MYYFCMQHANPSRWQNFPAFWPLFCHAVIYFDVVQSVFKLFFDTLISTFEWKKSEFLRLECIRMHLAARLQPHTLRKFMTFLRPS